MGYGDGRVYQEKRKDGTLKSSRWTVAYYVNGVPKWESGFKTEKDARKFLRQQIAARDAGQIIATEDTTLVVNAGIDTFEADLESRAKSPDTSRSHLKPIRAAFGDRRVLTLQARDFEAYRVERLAAGLSRATIDKELRLLRAALRLARKQERISRVPHIPMYGKSGDHVRQGFVDHDQFERVAANLSGALVDVARFAYLSAWRRGEVVPLRWTEVDRKAREVRLGTSKSGDPRTLPLEGQLWDLIERRWQARHFRTPDGPALSPLVFHDGGRPVGDFRKAWRSACRDAGVPDLHFHDLRRSGIRNLIRAGVPQSVAMSISGHRTVSTFIRYAIANDEDKREALRAVQERVGRAVSNVVALKPGENPENRG